MDWTDLLGIGASAASGGLLGVIGGVFGSVAKYFQRKQEIAAKREERAHELALLELQMRAKAEETEQEVLLANTQGSWNGLAASYEAEGRIGDSYPWVNAVRSLFRPFITLVLWVLAIMIFFAVRGGWLNEIMDPVSRGELILYLVNSTVFCAATATLWWFADRALQPPGMRHR